MLMAIVADAIFCAALFFETLALLSILQSVYGLQLGEVFAPIMSFYHAKTAPFVAFGASLFAGKAPIWFADAAIIAAVLFFSFFIAQARRAMAPYDDYGPYAPSREARTLLEGAIDLILPAAVCAIGAAVFAPTLLPYLTLPIALLLLSKKLLGKPSWFEVSPSYYVNVVLLAAIAAAILGLAR